MISFFVLCILESPPAPFSPLLYGPSASGGLYFPSLLSQNKNKKLNVLKGKKFGNSVDIKKAITEMLSKPSFRTEFRIHENTHGFFFGSIHL